MNALAIQSELRNTGKHSTQLMKSATSSLETVLKENQQLQEKISHYQHYLPLLESALEGYQKLARTMQKDLKFEMDLEKITAGSATSNRSSGERNRLLGFKTSIPLHPEAPMTSSQPTFSRILGGTWLMEPEAPEAIAEAELLIQQNKIQSALVHLDTHCPPISKVPSQYVNALLLKSCVLRNMEFPKRALDISERALFIAGLNDVSLLICKAQYHRGLALYDLGLYAEAHHCFTRAASIQWYARDIERMTRAADTMRWSLPVGAKGRHLDPDFQTMPKVVSATGFGAVNP